MSATALIASLFAAAALWKLVKHLTTRSGALAKVAGPPRESWLKGNIGHLFHDALEYNLKLAEEYGGVVKMHEMYGKEALYVSDPLALQYVFGKEQHAYDVNDAFIYSNLLMFGEGLIGTEGEQHRKQRKMLNPVFSASNMRDLLPVIQPIADEMAAVFLRQIPEDGSSLELDVMPWLSRGAQEYISQACFGYTFNALDLNKRNEYSEAARRYTPAALRVSYLRPFLPFIVRTFPLSWRKKMAEWYPSKDFKDFVYILDVMHKASQRIYAEKKAALERPQSEQNLHAAQRSEGDLGVRMKGKDIMSILLKANASSNETDRMTDSELIGQMSTLLFAGFETTTYAISRILWVLASRPDAQIRLRSEIRDAKRRHMEAANPAGGKWEDVALSYDQLMALPYLDAIIRETLRVHPPSSVHFRVTKEPTSLPLHTPARSVEGHAISTIPLEAGTTILVSIIASNHNKIVWGEDAGEWKPERWLAGSDASSQVESVGADGYVRYPGVYSSMMTFLGGPRGCIGFKFSEMEAKQVLATLLPLMHFALPSATDEQGRRKEIYWNMSGPQIPTVRPPFGDGVSAQVPLDVRRVRSEDFL